MNKFLTQLVCAVGLMALNACSSKTIPAKECIELNNIGIDYMMKSPYADTKKAIEAFKQAVNCDSTYPLSYTNLVNAYEQEGNNKEAIKILDKLLILTSQHPHILVWKAKLSEKMGNIDSANYLYNKAAKSYNLKLRTEPKNVDLITNKIHLMAITDGKQKAIQELEKQIATHPDLEPRLSTYRGLLEDFDRHSVITGEPKVIEYPVAK